MTNNLHGIVLKRINLKNDDKLITVYTKELGKITAIAKGVKKLNSKRRSSTEIFNIINLNVKPYHDINYLQDTVIIKSFKFNMSAGELIASMYVLEIIDKIMPLDEPNINVFDLLSKTIQFLSNIYNDNIINAYNLKLLKMLGFLNSSKFKDLKPDVIDYLSNLENQTLDEILELKASSAVQKFSRSYLVNITEGIIESKIKTLFISSKLN